MINNHNNKVKKFIFLLKNFDISVFDRSKYIFNPWADFDENDIEKANEVRCQNLESYLINIENPKYILIAESPSKGARYTGIAMTSEKVIKEYKLPFQYTSANYKRYKKGESTANKVWNEIHKSDNNFAFWNAFAFNIHMQRNKWFETPLKEELIQNKQILNEFINLYPNARIIALGTTAELALNIIGINNIECVRHPSNDYKKLFPKQIIKYL